MNPLASVEPTDMDIVALLSNVSCDVVRKLIHMKSEHAGLLGELVRGSLYPGTLYDNRVRLYAGYVHQQGEEYMPRRLKRQ